MELMQFLESKDVQVHVPIIVDDVVTDIALGSGGHASVFVATYHGKRVAAKVFFLLSFRLYITTANQTNLTNRFCTRAYQVQH